MSISANEIYDQMNGQDMEEMYNLLKPHFTNEYDRKTIDQQEYESALENLKSRYHSISKEDEYTILQISKKY